MWEEQARRTRRDLADLAAAGMRVGELHAAAIALVGRRVSTELTCWAALDPQTLVISSMTSSHAVPSQCELLLAHAEYSGSEPHTFAELARIRRPIARLSDLSDAERRTSARLNAVWRPLGLDEELRVLFAVDGTCWAAAGLVRAGVPFTDRETSFLAAVAPAVAAATRVAVRSEARGQVRGGGAPAVVVVGSTGQPRAETPAAREWQGRLDAIAPGRFHTMMLAMAVGAHASGGTLSARVRDASGQWALLRASPLVGADEVQVAVVIEPVGGDQLLEMLMAAYGLSSREREVCREVIAGHATIDIAARLFISGYTVQDHLKSVFAKAGVRSRGELVALLRPAEAATYAAETSP